tara:strand:+ start:179 stop:1036 length:858 start_codon:yes stop_codon:yes gene_type:complete
MSRVIYSLYIDIDENELDFYDKNILKKDHMPGNLFAKIQFKKNYNKLKVMQKAYADENKCDYILFENDNQFKDFKKVFQEKYPYLTTYNIVNFYKLYLLYELSNKYDEILYLDFDVVPLNFDNFFEQNDLSKGIFVLNNNERVSHLNDIGENTQTIRSPNAKYYNAQAMLLEKGLNTKNDVINTGIIGINKQHLIKLNYFKDFDENLNLMTKLKSDDMFPKRIVKYFGYDNETLFSVKLQENKVPVKWLDKKWHYFFDWPIYIPEGVTFVHAINKKFDVIWDRYA